MLLKSDTVHDAWAATQRTVGIKLTIKETEYDASDITSLTFDSGALNGEALSLGSTYQNTIKVVFSHLIEGLALTDEIAPKLGIKLPDGTWDYTPLGVFVIDAEVQQDRNNNTTTVSASDRMCMMGGTYESKLTYPAAINDIAVEIANLAAVKINENDFARLPTDKVASFGKVTYRDAIGFVAQFAGGFATFDRDGLLDIRQLADPNFDIAPGQYQSKGLTKNEALYRIGGIACTVTTTTADDSGNETQDTTTLQSGSTAGTQITISNPGMTQDLLDGLYEQLQDLNFYPFSLSWFGDPNLEAGDWIEVQDTAGNTFKTPNLLYSLTFSGGVTATSKADTTVSASANFVYKGQLHQIVDNIRQYLNAAGQQVSEGIDEPVHPKAGDVWFKKSGPDTYIMMYKNDPETGLGSWVEEVSTKGVSGLDEELKAAEAKLNADILAVQANLSTAQKDVAALQTKLAANDATQAQLTKDLAANAQLVTANKQSVDAALVTVNETLNQAQTDTATAVKNADLAVTNAQSAIDASGLATQTANAANDAAMAAKNLATSTANSFATVQSQAATAASDAADAISAANKAQGDATSALGNSNTAISNAQDALNKYNNLDIGGRNYYSIAGLSKAYYDPTYRNISCVDIHLAPNTAYTVSTDAPVRDTIACDVFAGLPGFVPYSFTNGIGSGRPKTINTGADGVLTVGYHGLNIENGTYHIKVERGTVATDWTPAPEDVQVQISNINGELSKKVSQTDYDNLKGTVTSQGTQITENSKEIALAAKQSVVDTLSQQVTDNTSQLKLTATAASLEATSKKVDTLSQTVTDQGAKLDLTATSAQLKVTENKVDALNNIVSDNSAQLKLTATSAALETQSKRVDTISGQVDTNTAGITAANGEIELKASNSRVDTLSNTVEQQGIDLKVAQGELKLKLTQSDLTKGLDGYATQTWAQNQITATATELNSTMTTVQQQVQNSAVGTNLLQGTGTASGDASGGGGILVKGAFNGYDAIKTNTGWAGRFINLNSALSRTNAKAGDWFTISIYVKADKQIDTGSLEVYRAIGTDYGLNLYTIQMQTKPITTQWQQYSWSFQIDDNSLKKTNTRVEYGNDTGDNWIYWAGWKLEKGNLATDWCPNPADNASVTALSQLSQTVDGLTGTFATKNDLAATATQLKVTSDGLNLITDVTGTNGENVTQVIADVKNIKTTMTGANGVTTRLQTLEGFQDTATNNITNLQTQQTTLAGQYTSLIESADNKVRKPWFDDDQVGTWSGERAVVAGPDSNVQNITGHSKYLKLLARDTFEDGVGWFSVTPGEVYYFSGYMGSWGTTYAVNVGLNFITEDGTYSWVTATGFPANSNTPISAIAGSITVPAGVVRARTWVQIDGPADTDLGYAAIDGLRISKSASSSQITQLQGLIDERVMVDGKIAAALSLSADGGGTVTIRGASLYVTAASHFDAASIQSAAIANLDAEKITSGSIGSDRLATTKLNADNITSGTIAAERIATTALSATNITSGTLDVGKLTVKNLSADMIASGTIDASKITVKNLSASNIIGGELDAGLVNVKNLNASNIITGTLNAGLLNVIGLNADSITTGTISGANLAINLNTGEVMFQKGSIKSADGHLNIDVNDGTFTQSDGTKGMMFAKGNLYLSSSSWWDGLSNPDAAPKPDYGFIGYGDTVVQVRGFEVVGRDSLTLGLTDKGNPVMEYTASPVITMDRSNVVLDFAGELATIQAGKEFTIQTNPIYNLGQTPGIQIGSNVNRSGIGDRVFIDGSYVYVPSAYRRTSSGSANLIVAADGALVRTSSATKYKSNIERFRNTDMGETLLTLPQAHWYNKQDMQRYTDDPQHYSMPELDYGMIAEDLAAAGLEDLVVRGDDGQLEDIRYDRMTPALLPLLAKMKQEIEELKSAAKSA